MKLVIYTQYMENYGAHDWDGEGACPQYWKMKGGSTYVVENLTPSQAINAQRSGCPTLRSLIEYSNDGAREYIVGIEIADDSDKVCEDWETPVKLAYEGTQWVALEIQENDEYGYLNRKVARAIKTYTLLTCGNRRDYVTTYVMRNGDVVKSTDWADYISAQGEQ